MASVVYAAVSHRPSITLAGTNDSEQLSQVKTVPLIAVQSGNDEGTLGKLNVRIISGTGDVLLTTDPLTEVDLQQNSQVAVGVAKRLAQQKNIDVEDTDVVLDF